VWIEVRRSIDLEATVGGGRRSLVELGILHVMTMLDYVKYCDFCERHLVLTSTVNVLAV
jgi:hypothetical protein